MNRTSPYLRLAFVLALVYTGSTQAQEPSKANDIVSRHLDAIAPQKVRAAVKSRVVEGNLRFRVLVGGSGGATGTWDVVSSGRMLNIVLQFGAGEWRGEQFTYDGSKANVVRSTEKHQYSDFGLFMSAEDFMVKEGLLGGELSTGWALQNLQANDARIENLGLKKVHGKQLIGLQYFSKHSTDMQVRIYFDPETYRHVLTVYTLRRAPLMTGDIRTSSAQKEVRYTLEERFDDFQTLAEVTLPKRYTIDWTEEFQDGLTREFEWDLIATKAFADLPLDPANFAVK